MDDPVSFRTNNPGAQWMGPIAQQYGATDTMGLPGGNNAAVFPDPVSGAAAQFALLGKNYAGMPLSDAISKWSGGNSSGPYTDFITKRAGIAPGTVLTPEMLAGPQGLALAKAQAHWEAGKPYPLTDDQWAQAQSRAFPGSAPATAGAPAAAAAPNSSPGTDAPAAPVDLRPLTPPAPQEAAPSGGGVMNALGMIDPNKLAVAGAKYGPGMGMLNQQQSNPMNNPEVQAMLAPSRPMNGTPMSQMMKQQILASIFKR